MNCAAVVLAAGGSSRLGEPKQLLLCQGETLLERAVRLAHESGAQPVIVVLGAQADRLRGLVEKRAIVAINDDWQSGMSTSLRAGLQAALHDRAAAKRGMTEAEVKGQLREKESTTYSQVCAMDREP